jgi:hypothetical protein
MPRSNVGKKVKGAFIGECTVGHYMPFAVYIDCANPTGTDTNVETVTVTKLLPPGMKFRSLGIWAALLLLM